MHVETDTTHPRHPIQVVSRRTGITPDVLRAWERRYEAVSPNRSATQRRLYSDSDIERLTLLKQATLAGHSIGTLAQRSNGDLQEIIAADRAATLEHSALEGPGGRHRVSEDIVTSALDAVREMDPMRLQSVLNRASLHLSPSELIEWVFVPLMRSVGDLWHRGKLGIAHEHLATAIVRGVLSDLAFMRGLEVPGPRLIVATPPGQFHELGALVVAATAKSAGWDVTYLGPDVPSADVADAARRRGARAVALSLTLPDQENRLLEEIRSLRRLLPPDTVIMAGGMAAATYATALREIGALVLRDMPSLSAILSSLRSENGGRQ